MPLQSRSGMTNCVPPPPRSSSFFLRRAASSFRGSYFITLNTPAGYDALALRNARPSNNPWRCSSKSSPCSRPWAVRISHSRTAACRATPVRFDMSISTVSTSRGIFTTVASRPSSLLPGATRGAVAGVTCADVDKVCCDGVGWRADRMTTPSAGVPSGVAALLVPVCSSDGRSNSFSSNSNLARRAAAVSFPPAAISPLLITLSHHRGPEPPATAADDWGCPPTDTWSNAPIPARPMEPSTPTPTATATAPPAPVLLRPARTMDSSLSNGILVRKSSAAISLVAHRDVAPAVPSAGAVARYILFAVYRTT